jgi:predicted aspartyl protease
MSTRFVEFPLSPLKRKDGVVPEPIIPIGISTRDGYKLYDFLVDSGADFTLLPRSLADEIGIDLKKCPTSKTLGVEGKGIKIHHSQVRIRIGHLENRIRCAFAPHDHIPPLLGRLDIFSSYNITFSAEKMSIIFRRC